MITGICINRSGLLDALFSAAALILGAEKTSGKMLKGDAGERNWRPSVYLGIEPTAKVIIVAHRSEMGTGIRTAQRRSWQREMVNEQQNASRPGL
jgi:isoquinoline 1-oxidoreductase beta subunit